MGKMLFRRKIESELLRWIDDAKGQRSGPGSTLMVATNNELNSNARVMAENNQVNSFERSSFEEFLFNNALFFSEIQQAENEWYGQI